MKLNNTIIFMELRRIPRDDKSQYMTRFTFFECKYISFKLHKFHASDDQCLHDHPWSFLSFILWRGYKEIVPMFQHTYDRDLKHESKGGSKWYEFYTNRVYPGMIIYRPAKWIHRVEINKPAWTFVISFKRVRKWGFFTKTGWLHWKTYAALTNKENHC